MARSLGCAPTVLRGRTLTVTYLYDDPDQPGRVTGAVQAPAYTSDDRDLLVALEQYEASLCPGCGEPKDRAWHPQQGDPRHGGYEKGQRFVCHACTARSEDESGKTADAVFQGVRDTRDYTVDPLPPWPQPTADDE